MYKVSFYQIAITILSLFTTIVSCREDSDDVRCYAYEDFLNFEEANSSLEGQFKAIWTAMNCNYPMWDYEEQQGVNWDKVYDEFLPRFKELDREYNLQNPVPDSVMVELYYRIFAPLHDGHLYMYLENIHTGKNIGNQIFPQYLRNIRNDSKDLNRCNPTLNYYNDEKELAELIQEDDYIFAQFKDGIVYFRLPKFNLTDMFKERSSDENKDRICKLWEAWFNCIQDLQSANSLKGVIIDVRDNPGGNDADYQYVLGALHNGDNDEYGELGHKIGYQREKTGIGRLDFSRLYPFYLPVYEGRHAAVDAPIVILVNGLSGSMAEITTLAAKQLKNGYVIGTKTWGAFSPLNNSYAITYAGTVGDPALENGGKKTYFASFFIKIPSATFFSLNKQIVDSEGVEPNEIVYLDYYEHLLSGKDNQIDRALEYIRTRNK